ncbi:MAG: sugar ABC transporter substrate-binding protein [Muricoprocola sp.]
MKKYLVMLGAILATVFLSIITLQPLHEYQKQQPRLFGATYMTRNNPFFDVLHEGIEEVVEGNGDILISRDPSQNQDRQNAQIQEMIEEGIQILFLNPVDQEKVKPALEACKEAGVTVIDIDTVVENREYVTSIVETDNYKAGALCAEDMMKRKDSARIVVLDNPIQSSIVDRVRGFTDTIGDNTNYTVVYRDAAAGEFEVAAEKMNEILKQNIVFDVVLGGNDPSALGALATLQQNHKEEGILIYGIDGSPDFKAMLELGHVTATSAQSPKSIGTVAAETAYDYLAGKEIEPYISIEPYLINQENLENYEVDAWQ